MKKQLLLLFLAVPFATFAEEVNVEKEEVVIEEEVVMDVEESNVYSFVYELETTTPDTEAWSIAQKESQELVDAMNSGEHAGVTAIAKTVGLMDRLLALSQEHDDFHGTLSVGCQPVDANHIGNAGDAVRISFTVKNESDSEEWEEILAVMNGLADRVKMISEENAFEGFTSYLDDLTLIVALAKTTEGCDGSMNISIYSKDDVE